MMLTAGEESEREFSVQLFMLQLFLAPFACWVLGFCLALFAAGLFSQSVIAGHAAFALAGFCVGYKLHSKSPACYWSGGRWVWIPLAMLFLYAVLTEGITAWVSGDGVGEHNAFGIMLLTEPAIGACMYSVGLTVAKWRADQRTQTS